MQTSPAPSVRLRRMRSATLCALADDDLDGARRASGLDLPKSIARDSWLYRLRRDQVAHTPADADWIARIGVAGDGTVVGHAGFHGAPDAAGMVEVAYFVVPEHRGRGLARALLGALVDWAANEPDVRTLRASISPGNAPSLAVVAHFGFTRTGDRWDDEDGLEWVFERPARQPAIAVRNRAGPRPPRTAPDARP